MSAAEIERHVERCAECRTFCARLQDLRAAIRDHLPREAASP